MAKILHFCFLSKHKIFTFPEKKTVNERDSKIFDGLKQTNADKKSRWYVNKQTFIDRIRRENKY